MATARDAVRAGGRLREVTGARAPLIHAFRYATISKQRSRHRMASASFETTMPASRPSSPPPTPVSRFRPMRRPAMPIEPSSFPVSETSRSKVARAASGAVSRRQVVVSLLGAGLAACGGGGGPGPERSDRAAVVPGGGGGHGGPYGAAPGVGAADRQGRRRHARHAARDELGPLGPRAGAGRLRQHRPGRQLRAHPAALVGPVHLATSTAATTPRRPPPASSPGTSLILDQMVDWAIEGRPVDHPVRRLRLRTERHAGRRPGLAAYCDPRGVYPGGHNLLVRSDAARPVHRGLEVRRRPLQGHAQPGPVRAAAGARPERLLERRHHQQFYVEVTNAIRGVAPGIPFLIGSRPPSYSLYTASSAVDPAWNGRRLHRRPLPLHHRHAPGAEHPEPERSAAEPGRYLRASRATCAGLRASRSACSPASIRTRSTSTPRCRC